ncbi:MAG: hypothetical protein DRJ26_04805 [Candidatus Methanomethylicota archaeon]|uniref:Uncharacterized protein n=1 Tax=Thermoproteota archaeon TaxID=2056631 RepID=A0A497EZE0_9CREN|nr:MAG: hypothetical protein DRJ26_04805 [Candidatus Verstraetearchaeota archaeon]
MKRSDLKILYSNGLISSKPFSYFEIKDKVAQYRKQGMSKTDSVKATAKLTGVSIVTIWSALRSTKDIELV